MARMLGTGARPAVALSNVSAVMPWARAWVRISARKAVNLGSPELGAGAGAGAGWTVAGGGGGAGTGLGAWLAQADRARSATRRGMRAGMRIAMPLDTPFWGFLAEKLVFSP